MSTVIPFTKMVGTGNDFLIVDAMRRPLGALKTACLRQGFGRQAWPRVARAMCDRRDGIGADGLLLLERSRIADVRMRIFNPDGSEAEMCGNGARCVAGFVHQQRSSHQDGVSIETAGGLVNAQVHGDRVRMRMPDPKDIRLGLRLSVDPRIRTLAFLDTGVPHVVASVGQVDRVDVEGLGRTLRHHRAFQPRGANVNFVEVNRKTPHRLRIRTYERGVEGETLACGTGVTAAAVVHALGCDPSTRAPALAGGPSLGMSPATCRGVVPSEVEGRRSGAPGLPGGLHGRSDKTRTDARRYQLDVETRSGEHLRVSLAVTRRGRTRSVMDVVLEGGVRWICEGRFRWR